jgi:hypothetical protein
VNFVRLFEKACRQASKIVVGKEERHNNKGDRTAFGTGTYMLG